MVGIGTMTQRIQAELSPLLIRQLYKLLGWIHADSHWFSQLPLTSNACCGTGEVTALLALTTVEYAHCLAEVLITRAIAGLLWLAASVWNWASTLEARHFILIASFEWGEWISVAWTSFLIPQLRLVCSFSHSENNLLLLQFFEGYTCSWSPPDNHQSHELLFKVNRQVLIIQFDYYHSPTNQEIFEDSLGEPLEGLFFAGLNLKSLKLHSGYS